jgi:hypothetical protein
MAKGDSCPCEMCQKSAGKRYKNLHGQRVCLRLIRESLWKRRALKTAAAWVGIGYVLNIPILITLHAAPWMWAANAVVWAAVFTAIYNEEKRGPL